MRIFVRLIIMSRKSSTKSKFWAFMEAWKQFTVFWLLYGLSIPQIEIALQCGVSVSFMIVREEVKYWRLKINMWQSQDMSRETGGGEQRQQTNRLFCVHPSAGMDWAPVGSVLGGSGVVSMSRWSAEIFLWCSFKQGLVVLSKEYIFF